MKPLRRWSLFRPRTDGASPFNHDDEGAANAAVAVGAGSKRAANGTANSAVSADTATLPAGVSGVRGLVRPAMRWVGPAGRIALREFEFSADADAVCSFQQETYVLNFPEFHYTDSFAAAFRHDLRRAALDPHHGLFVLDAGQLVGFLWVVVCENTWTGERYGYINNIYVASDQRGCGLGRELMKQSDTFFRSRSIKKIRLTVTSSNDVAAELYRKSGYEVARWEMEKEL